MKYFLCLFIFLPAYFLSEAQYNVVFKLDRYPLQHSNDTIFLAGSFNAWDPRNIAYKIFPAGENTFSLQLPAGEYEYKCTRGNWKKVESLNNGKDIENHFIKINRDTTIEINIEAWKDDFVAVPKEHTASDQVQILDTAFFIPQLNRTRRIWIYLPEGYAKSKKKYPVMYMQDGQNLFDANTSGFGEWGADECLDSLIAKGKPACIIIGIDNGVTTRMSEYNPYEFILESSTYTSQKYLPEGKEYVNFLVETLKPFIDKKYRTLPSKENTIIAGSSMGGLISYYAMLQQPNIFGKAGIFSPAFWTAPPVRSLTDSLAGKVSGKFFFYMGGMEGGTYIEDMKEVQEVLGEKSSAMIYSVIDSESNHNEQAWRKWFAEFYNWIMADGYNTVIKVKD